MKSFAEFTAEQPNLKEATADSFSVSKKTIPGQGRVRCDHPGCRNLATGVDHWKFKDGKELHNYRCDKHSKATASR